MLNRIRRAVILSFGLAAVVGAGACLPPPGVACGEGWCAEGYRCASVDLTAICIKSACGDGIVDADEECDDGNLADNDDCLQACKLNTCGDGQINLRTEACDDGNGANGDGCDSNCTVPACGNGAVAPGEMCDDGNGDDNDGCDSDCTTSLLTYIKASNTGAYDYFGYSVALSADGSTLAVGAWLENSTAKGINGDQVNDGAPDAGAVYVFTRSGTAWSQQAYVKASNTYTVDRFGASVALSADGSTLAVGAIYEDSAAKGIDGNQDNDRASASGAVYVFTRSGTTWGQQAYVKASNTDAGDQFGWSVALSDDGTTLAVGANLEDSVATGTRGNPEDNSAVNAGAVYLFTRSGTPLKWSQQAYVKASNTDVGDQFGYSVALSANGSTLAVGAIAEGSKATGIDGDQTNDSVPVAGAVYVFTRSGTTWSQQAYVKPSQTHTYQYFGDSVALSDNGSTLAVGGPAGAAYVFTRSGTPLKWIEQARLKASNAEASDRFGDSVALSADGSTLAVGASLEDSTAIGSGGDQANNGARDAGAVYVFTRSGMPLKWSQQAYVKSSNTGSEDQFGASLALSADGSTLAVGALEEDCAATGIFGDRLDNSASEAGAAYVFMELLGL